MERNDDQIPEAQLVDLAEEAFRARYSEVVAEMVQDKKWFTLEGSFKGAVGIDYENCAFHEITSPKYLALGRSQHYDAFIELLSARYGFPVQQSDYMVWIAPSNPYRSLSYYIETAEHIDFSLQGISIDDLRTSLHVRRKVDTRDELGTRYMTLWELNQVWFSDNCHKTVWHVPAVVDLALYRRYFRDHWKDRPVSIVAT